MGLVIGVEDGQRGLRQRGIGCPWQIHLCFVDDHVGWHCGSDWTEAHCVRRTGHVVVVFVTILRWWRDAAAHSEEFSLVNVRVTIARDSSASVAEIGQNDDAEQSDGAQPHSRVDHSARLLVGVLQFEITLSVDVADVVWHECLVWADTADSQLRRYYMGWPRQISLRFRWSVPVGLYRLHHWDLRPSPILLLA